MSVHDELVKLQEKWQRMGSKSEGIPARSHTLTECADGLAPILAAARAQEKELAAMKELHEKEIADMGAALRETSDSACKMAETLHTIREQHSADLREIAEMSIANYGEAIRLSDAGFELVSLPTADSILAEFREKKAEVGK